MSDGSRHEPRNGRDRKSDGELARFDGVLGTDPHDPKLRSALLPTLHPGDSHAATLVANPEGDLLCAWFNGPGEGEPDTNIVLARLPHGTDTWTTSERMSADPERSEQNPVLFVTPGGEVWLLHTSNEPHDQKSSRVLRRVSTDGGITWGPATVFLDGPGSFLRNPMVVMHDGHWLLPAYHCADEGESTVLVTSSDRGKSWSAAPLPDSLGQVQASIVELAPDRLLAYFRSRAADRIHRSISTDGGRTWSTPERTPLPNNNCAIQLLRLADGRLVLVLNDASAERDQFRWVPDGNGGMRRKTLRTPLTLALSEDDGATWPHWRNLQMQDEEYLDNEFGYSYPWLLQDGSGDLHVVYSYLRKTIKHVVLTPDWLETGGRLP